MGELEHTMSWREVLEWGAFDKMEQERALERRHKDLHKQEFARALADLRR